MCSASVEEFELGRRRWLDSIVARIVDHRVEEVLSNNGAGLSQTERALLVVHVGLSHLYGVSDKDTSIREVLSESEVGRLLTRLWRPGRFDVRLASKVNLLWPCLFKIGRDAGAVRIDLLRELFASQVGRRMRDESGEDLEPDLVDTAVLGILRENPLSSSVLEELGSFDLDCPGSHLPIVRALIERDMAQAVQTITSLEIEACAPDDGRTKRNDEAMQLVSRRLEFPLIVQGGWPGPGASDVPDWVTDTVLSGSRLGYASTGFVPGWMLVAESQDEFNAMRQWAYNPSVFLGVVDDNPTIVLGITLTLPSDGESTRAEWAYPLRNAHSLAMLKTIIAMGILRVDIYRINGDAGLEYAYSHGFLLPGALLNACHSYLDDHEPRPEEVKHMDRMDAHEQLLAMARIEQHAFGHLTEGFAAQPDSGVAAAYRQYLEIQDATTAARFSSFPADPKPLEEAREALRMAIAASTRQDVEPIDLSILGAGRAYVQFRVTLDAPVLLTARSAYFKLDGHLEDGFHEFSGPFDDSWSVEEQSAALAEAFQGLGSMRRYGISNLVVNAHSAAYNLPYHEALLRIGFSEVSYTHRAASLTPKGPVTPMESVVCGHAGEDRKFIPAVNFELEIVSELYGTNRSELIGKELPSLVHLAGHGYAGDKSYEVAIQIEPTGPPLSSARVLLDYDARAVDLVYLSGCSTGHGSYGPRQLTETVPLDVAFIEKGARVVLSTSAPVNDSVACFFASVFHEARSRGSNVWDAYTSAREATKLQEVPPDLSRLNFTLARTWPLWRDDLAKSSAIYPHDWQLFRLSGRHWE